MSIEKDKNIITTLFLKIHMKIADTKTAGESYNYKNNDNLLELIDQIINYPQ